MEAAPCTCSRTRGLHQGYGRAPGQTFGGFAGPDPLGWASSATSIGGSSASASKVVTKRGSGGYVYEQVILPATNEGDIRIVATPRGATSILVKARISDSRWVAITREIGPTTRWAAWFKAHPTAGLSTGSASANSYARSAASSLNIPTGTAGSGSGKWLNLVQTAAGLASQFASGGSAPSTQTVAVPAPEATSPATASEPEETPTSTYLLWGGVGVAAIVVLGLLVSGKPRAAPSQV